MKRMISRLSLLAAVLMITAVPVMANDGKMDPAMGQEQQTGKDECLLVVRNCQNAVDSIQERIERIQNEISRGSAVYTNDELRRLERQLEDANRNMEQLTSGA